MKWVAVQDGAQAWWVLVEADDGALYVQYNGGGAVGEDAEEWCKELAATLNAQGPVVLDDDAYEIELQAWQPGLL